MALTDHQKQVLRKRAAAKEEEAYYMRELTAQREAQERHQFPIDDSIVDVNPGENNAYQMIFSQSLLCPWIEGSLRIMRNQRMIEVDRRNTLFGIFPAGKSSEMIRMTNVSGVNLYYEHNNFRIIIGLLCIIAALTIVPWSMAATWIVLKIVAVCGGILLIQANIQTGLTIQRVSDSQNTCFLRLPFYERDKMKRAKGIIEDALIRAEERVDIERAAYIVVDGLS